MGLKFEKKKDHITVHDIENGELWRKVGQEREKDRFVQEGKEKN